MSKSLIRKNQLHPDIGDLVTGYGESIFVKISDFSTLSQNLSGIVALNTSITVLTTGNQNISGIKNFFTRPTVNGTGVLLQGEVIMPTLANVVYTTGNQTINGVKSFTSLPNVNGIPLSTGIDGNSEYVFPSNLTVNLTPGKTFGRYQNGDTIEAAGLTTSQVIQLAITEKINPSVSLTITSPSTSSFLIGQTNISTILSRNYTINNAGASISSASLEWKRGDQSIWNVLNTATTPTSFTHTFTNTVNNSNSINYRYIVTDSEGSTNTATANVSFLYGNYFGYSSASSLTTVGQIEALGNQILSDGKSRTVNSVTAGAGLYTYYAYRADAGDLISITDGLEQFLGAFTKQTTDINGTNLNGVNVSYRVYRSNAPQAFTNVNLTLS